MKAARILASLAMLTSLPGAVHAQTGCARLSWGTCDPWVENTNFTGPGTYTLVESVFGVSTPHSGTESQIRIRHSTLVGDAVPDAWRFDDAGCQTSSRVTYSNTALNKGCPAMKGAGVLTVTQYTVDTDGSAFLFLAITHDGFNPIATARYTTWQVMFDHSLSNVGPSPLDQSTCGGAELCENISLDYAALIANDYVYLGVDLISIAHPWSLEW